jgi:hypothetical protein
MHRVLPRALVLGFGLALSLAPASAGVDIDFGAAVHVGDRSDLYVSISSRYFERDRATVATVYGRYADPDDAAVALFVSSHSGRSPDSIHDLRLRGLGWWEIGAMYGVPIDAWYVPVPRDPGPPYGKAYGHWKKHKNRSKRYVLRDAEVRHLVAVRMIHEYYGVPVEVAMQWRADGRPIRDLMCEEYDRRHGARVSYHEHDDDDRVRGNGHGHGHHKGPKHKDR